MSCPGLVCGRRAAAHATGGVFGKLYVGEAIDVFTTRLEWINGLLVASPQQLLRFFLAIWVPDLHLGAWLVDCCVHCIGRAKPTLHCLVGLVHSVAVATDTCSLRVA